MHVKNIFVAVALLAIGANSFPASYSSSQVARRADEEWTKVLAEAEKRSPSDEEWTKVLAEAEKRSPSDEEWTKVLAEAKKV
ncbi:hypothetical protein AnigIFM56816_005887 [Aspergillus niger]|nr:hypothetical protein AnigIFM56816_005887 [Aspergillus niger]